MHAHGAAHDDEPRHVGRWRLGAGARHHGPSAGRSDRRRCRRSLRRWRRGPRRPHAAQAARDRRCPCRLRECGRPGRARRSGPRGVRPARRCHEPSRAPAPPRRPGSDIWLLWHRSAATLRSTVAVVSTATPACCPPGPMIHSSGTDPGLETLDVEQLGMGERVARVGVHRVDCGLAGGQVVGVAGENELEVPLGRLRQHPLGPDLTDDAADVTPQLAGRFDHAVGVPEEPHVADADHGGRGTLLVLAERRHFGPGHGAVGAAGFAARGDAVRHLEAGRGEGRHGARRAEVDVVGVRGDHQDTANPVLRRPDRDRCFLAQRTLSSGRGVQAARSARRGSLENISTIGIRRPSRR